MRIQISHDHPNMACYWKLLDELAKGKRNSELGSFRICGEEKGIAHNSVDSDRKFLISGNNEAEIIQRSNHLING